MRLILFTAILLTCNFLSAQTQLDLNQTAAESYKKADAELNKVYKQILIQYKTDTLFVNNLKDSQRIWIKFRDAELMMKYPEREQGYYGSIQPVCVANYLEKLTRERIKTLNTWLIGVEEGDVCSGSIHLKE
jgi:uncharacterized protein YecT (DUF1311 family)